MLEKIEKRKCVNMYRDHSLPKTFTTKNPTHSIIFKQYVQNTIMPHCNRAIN